MLIYKVLFDFTACLTLISNGTVVYDNVMNGNVPSVLLDNNSGNQIYCLIKKISIDNSIYNSTDEAVFNCTYTDLKSIPDCKLYEDFEIITCQHTTSLPMTDKDGKMGNITIMLSDYEIKREEIKKVYEFSSLTGIKIIAKTYYDMDNLKFLLLTYEVVFMITFTIHLAYFFLYYPII